MKTINYEHILIKLLMSSLLTAAVGICIIGILRFRRGCDYVSFNCTDTGDLLVGIFNGRPSQPETSEAHSGFQGRLFWVTSNDGQEPLKDHVERMAELLGI